MKELLVDIAALAALPTIYYLHKWWPRLYADLGASIGLLTAIYILWEYHENIKQNATFIAGLFSGVALVSCSYYFLERMGAIKIITVGEEDKVPTEVQSPGEEDWFRHLPSRRSPDQPD